MTPDLPPRSQQQQSSNQSVADGFARYLAELTEWLPYRSLVLYYSECWSCFCNECDVRDCANLCVSLGAARIKADDAPADWGTP